MRAVSIRFAGVVFAAALLATVAAAQSTEYGGATAPVTPNYGGATPSAEYGGVTPVPEVPKPPSSIIVEDDLVDMEDLLSVSVPEGLSPYDMKMLIVERLSARLEDLNQKVDMYHQERARVEAAMELSFQRLQDQYRAFALREKDRLNARDLPAVVRDLYESVAMMEEEQEKHFSQAQQWSRIAKASFDRVLKLEKQRDVLQRKIVAAAIEVTTLPRPTLEA